MRDIETAREKEREREREREEKSIIEKFIFVIKNG
jgi:hypothetical protein